MTHLPTNLLRSASDLRQLCASDPVAPHPHVGQAAELMEQAAGEIEGLEFALRLILPMAKGYAYQHQVGINREMIEHAEAALNTQSI